MRCQTCDGLGRVPRDPRSAGMPAMVESFVDVFWQPCQNPDCHNGEVSCCEGSGRDMSVQGGSDG